MGGRDKTSEKKKSVGLSYRKIPIHLGAKKSVINRIDEMAYKAGIMRHELFERAIKYALKRDLNIQKIAQDPIIQKFLSARQNDVTSNAYVRIDPQLYAELKKMTEKYGIRQKEFMKLVIAYYIVYVLKLVTPESRLKQS